jgi:hypothetical protein
LTLERQANCLTLSAKALLGLKVSKFQGAPPQDLTAGPSFSRQLLRWTSTRKAAAMHCQRLQPLGWKRL